MGVAIEDAFGGFACSKDGAGFQVDPTDDALGGTDRFAN